MTENERQAMEMALAAHKDEIKLGDLNDAAKTVYKAMTQQELQENLGHE